MLPQGTKYHHNQPPRNLGEPITRFLTINEGWVSLSRTFNYLPTQRETPPIGVNIPLSSCGKTGECALALETRQQQNAQKNQNGDTSQQLK